MWNLPNILTLLRIVALPPMLWMGYWAAHGPMADRQFYGHAAAWTFLAIFLTDMVDGWLARRWDQVTNVGKLLDPLADKLLVLAALVILVEMDRVSSWVTVLVVGREMAVTALRSMAAADQVVISAAALGKAKTTFQSASLALLLHWDPVGPWSNLPAHVYGYPIFWAGVALTVISGVEYYIRYFLAIRRGATSQEIQREMNGDAS